MPGIGRTTGDGGDRVSIRTISLLLGLLVATAGLAVAVSLGAPSVTADDPQAMAAEGPSASQVDLAATNATLDGTALDGSSALDGTDLEGAEEVSVVTGDVTGDGATDTLVGVSAPDPDAETTGTAYLFYGTSEDPDERTTLEADRANATFARLSTAGDARALTLADVNGDGTDEVAGVNDGTTDTDATDPVAVDDTTAADADLLAFSAANWTLVGGDDADVSHAVGDADDEASIETSTEDGSGETNDTADADGVDDGADADGQAAGDAEDGEGGETSDSSASTSVTAEEGDEADESDEGDASGSESESTSDDGADSLPGADDLEGARVGTQCGATDGTIGVENPNGDADLHVEVYGPDGYYAAHSLAPGERHEFESLADGSYDVAASTTVNLETVSQETVDVGCESDGDGDGSDDGEEEEIQGVSVSTACAGEGGTVGVDNPNAETDVHVEVYGPEGYYAARTVAGGESHDFEDVGDGQYDVYGNSVVNLETYNEETVAVDCGSDGDEEDGGETEPVAPDISTTCASESGSIQVQNPNDATELRVEVAGNGEFSSQTVAGGESVEFSGLDPGGYEVVATGPDDSTVSWDTVQVDCDSNDGEDDDGTGPAGATASVQCAGDSGAIAVSNPNDDQALVVDVDGPDTSDRAVLDAGGSVEFDVGGDGQYDVASLDEEGNTIETTSVTVDCDSEAGSTTEDDEVATPDQDADGEASSEEGAATGDEGTEGDETTTATPDGTDGETTESGDSDDTDADGSAEQEPAGEETA